MTKLFYVNMDGQRQYCESLLKLRKISLFHLILNEDTMARYRIYTEDGKIIEAVFMVILNGTIYVCYQHFSSDKIRCYRSYNSAGDFKTAWTLCGKDNEDIDWIEILSMRDKQLFGMKKQRTDLRAFDELTRSISQANRQFQEWTESRL